MKQWTGRLRCAAALAGLGAMLVGPAATAQTRRTTPAPARRAPAPAPPKIEAAELKCPAVLGEGVQTRRTFCDVQIGRDPAEGIIVTVPPHTGDVTLTFDLHNRHTYSEQQVANKRGYHRYAATIGVLTPDNTLLSRAAIISEFRTAADLVDRIGGGSGPGGLKAVAPTGSQAVVITIPAEFKVDAVSILGEKLNVVRVEGNDDFSASGRPIAVISNVMLEYRPAPPPPPPRRAPARR
jgi:hypothetical protein